MPLNIAIPPSLFVKIKSKYKIKIYGYDKKGFLFYRHFGTLIVLPPYTGDRKGVLDMETLTTLILAIVASVVSHCVCKWLDSREHR